MKSVRMTCLLLMFAVLAACAAPVSNISAPPVTATPAPTATPEASFANGVVLTSGHYQLLMLYSPL